MSGVLVLNAHNVTQFLTPAACIEVMFDALYLASVAWLFERASSLGVGTWVEL
jgi:hypothetical protein